MCAECLQTVKCVMSVYWTENAMTTLSDYLTVDKRFLEVKTNQKRSNQKKPSKKGARGNWIERWTGKLYIVNVETVSSSLFARSIARTYAMWQSG